MGRAVAREAGRRPQRGSGKAGAAGWEAMGWSGPGRA
uniref:Uncharacterized protein n=1 Tax=Arundo donax TaxID=35708 RepID=A0A0A9UEC0_ARUDO